MFVQGPTFEPAQLIDELEALGREWAIWPISPRSPTADDPPMGLRAKFRSRSGRRTERGATLVEYALLIAVFVIPAYAGVSFLQSTAKTKMGTVATRVANPPTTTTSTP